MDVNIRHLSAWYAHCDELSVEEAINSDETDVNWPKLTFVPAMQRRRLSSFAKMALQVANESMTGIEKKLPIIFSSRHGDLVKTSGLLVDLTKENSLSPTAFGLSVHNAIPSLFSILTSNKHAVNAISAGQNSFMMALIDSYSRLKSGLAEEILFIHVDQKLPDTYIGFQDEQQLSHAISMVLSLPSKKVSDLKAQSITLDYVSSNQLVDDNAPASLLFLQWYNSQNKKALFSTNQYHWSLEKYA